MPGHAASREYDNKHELIHNPQRRKYLPKFAGSPFGDFPDDFTTPAQKRRMLNGSKAQTAAAAAQKDDGLGPGGLAARQSPKRVHHDFLRSHHTHGCFQNKKVADSKRHAEDAAMRPAEKPTMARELIRTQDPSTMFDSVPQPPKNRIAFARHRIPPTEFRRFYERGDIPVTIMHGGKGRRLKWGAQIQDLDFHHYLPILFDGLRELEEPYKFVATQGCFDLIAAGSNKILPTVPQLIIPMKTALATHDSEIMCTVLRVLQRLVTSAELVGEALVPYYRQLLGPIALFKDVNLNLGDRIEYSQRKNQNIGDLIHETLQVLEKFGGPDAYINIKFLVPTYESCVLN